YLATVSPPGTTLHRDFGVSVWRIKRWRTNNWNLAVEAVRSSGALEEIKIKGVPRFVSSSSIALEIGGSDGKWKADIQLDRESRMKISMEETKKKIEGMERK